MNYSPASIVLTLRRQALLFVINCVIGFKTESERSEAMNGNKKTKSTLIILAA